MSSALFRPRPTQPPVYRNEGAKVSSSSSRIWNTDDVLDALFFAIAALAALWLSWVILGSAWRLGVVGVVNALVFWAVLAYIALPRLHQVLTWLYVPDYFIGRTRTTDGLLGDPVNLALLGDEEDLHEAMTAAGWVRADPITPASSWRIVVASVLRRSYPQAPVSPLVLFGRTQDVAYQKEVAGNPAQRHHVRYWHTPEGWKLPGGRQVDWLAAATYDRAVGLSTFTFQVTHKIDANIDLERNYVVDDVLWACPSARNEVLADFFTSYHSTNGGGDRIMTDGDLHVLDISEVVLEPSNSLELARSRAEEAEARRARPLQLLIALALIAVNAVWRGIDVLRYGLSGAVDITWAQVEQIVVVLDRALSQDAARAQGIEIGFAVASVALSLAIVILAVSAWRGHPRGRIALMVVLTVKLGWDVARIHAVGVTGASFSLVAASALGVLALLALSARVCHLWERSRKAERRQRRAGRANSADVPEASRARRR